MTYDILRELKLLNFQYERLKKFEGSLSYLNDENLNSSLNNYKTAMSLAKSRYGMELKKYLTEELKMSVITEKNECFFVFDNNGKTIIIKYEDDLRLEVEGFENLDILKKLEDIFNKIYGEKIVSYSKNYEWLNNGVFVSVWSNNPDLRINKEILEIKKDSDIEEFYDYYNLNLIKGCGKYPLTLSNYKLLFENSRFFNKEYINYKLELLASNYPELSFSDILEWYDLSKKAFYRTRKNTGQFF